jgi:hypothetical protein
MGASLLNLLGLVVEEQVTLAPHERSRLVTLVDESSTLGAADYGRMLSELGKYGASFVLVTQSLAKLDAIDRALRPTVFSNIDGLTVFQTSAEDGEHLVEELGSGLAVSDLTDLDDFACYARWWADGRKLPAFSLRLTPPTKPRPGRVEALAHASAERHGRPRVEVAAVIDQRLSQRGGQSGVPADGAGQEASGEHDSNAEGVQPTAKKNPSPPGRSKNRDRGRKRS